MISEAVQLELAKNAIGLVTALFVGVASMVGLTINGVLTIRNGRRTTDLANKDNGSLEAIEKARLIESDRLMAETVRGAGASAEALIADLRQQLVEARNQNQVGEQPIAKP